MLDCVKWVTDCLEKLGLLILWVSKKSCLVALVDLEINERVGGSRKHLC